MELTLDDIVTLPLADELRRVLSLSLCRCPDCRAARTWRCDVLLDLWLERTRGHG